MARKMYETQATLDAEREVANYLEKTWNTKFRKLSYKEIVDFAVCTKGSDEIKAWVEVKTRTIASTTLPYYMISMHKINHGINLYKTTGLPFFLVIKFTDCLLYTSPSPRDRTRSRMPSSA